MAFTNKHTQGNWNAVAYGDENKIGFSTHEIQYSEDGRNSIAMQAVKMALSKAGVELNNKPIDV